MVEQKFKMDGEKVSVQTEAQKLTAKQVIDALGGIDNNINQMKQQLTQFEQQKKTVETNLADATKQQSQLKEFEEKCIAIQTDKLKLYIEQLRSDLMEQALKSAEKTIAASPEAYTEEQKKQLPYLDFQKLLATNGKVAENISSKIIQEQIWVKPVFENPFK